MTVNASNLPCLFYATLLHKIQGHLQGSSTIETIMCKQYQSWFLQEELKRNQAFKYLLPAKHIPKMIEDTIAIDGPDGKLK